MTPANAPIFRTLRVEVDGRLGHLTLDQPERLNAIGALALRELAEAAAWFDATPVSVVVVRGAGRAFCAGFDRRELVDGPPEAELEQHAGAATPALGAAMAEAVSSMRALTVAAIQGPCVGGGFVLALCCDVRIAADDAWFSLPEAELGIPLAWSGVPRLVRELGPARANELILTCRRVAAVEAARLGLVNEIVERAVLDDAVAERTAVLLERKDAVIVATKRQVRASAEAMVPTAGTWAGTEELVAALRDLLRPGP
ncbi:enoyl-CoA hydratase/isomerase family protein [Aquihabitans daechungensis]|uniref:enoyl-CoA hydratase/isomerase family protein n=1 Tax=Aquihabitans daechungensis TaxID=1052257 RepID=UPI003B9F628D